MRHVVIAIAVLIFTAASVEAGISVRRSPYNAKTVDVYVINEPLTNAVGALEMYLPFRVQMLLGKDPIITVRARQVSPLTALKRIVAAAAVELKIEHGQYWITDNREPVVNIDVKDAEVREILKTMQRQCGIKNLMIDPNVSGTGTFMFTDVPCKIAFHTVFRSLGLAAETYPNSVITVGVNKSQ